MLTQEQIRERLDRKKRVYVLPNLDDFESSDFRRICIEFQYEDGSRFAAKHRLERPHHYITQIYEWSGDARTYEVKVYDEWDEDWVDRGVTELLDMYSEQLFASQRHLAILEEMDDD